MLRACHQNPPVISVDLGEFLTSQNSPNLLIFLNLSGGGHLYSTDKAAWNLRFSNLWRNQVERKDRCFNSDYKGIIYQNSVIHN